MSIISPKKRYKQFIFEKYEFDHPRGTVRFYYSLDKKVNFVDTLTFPAAGRRQINPALLNKILFNLHLALGISYYKTYCPKKIIINSGKLNKPQAEFWNKLYTKGLGEFFYKNKIDFRGLINFPYSEHSAKPIAVKLKERALVPLGGGKDSCVVIEELKKRGASMRLITLRDSDIQKNVARIAGQKRLIIDRRLDSQLMLLNDQGAYNGHIPISAIYSWVSILAAALYDYKYVIFANEKSANFGNVKYLGAEINHQYSKSFEFEKDLSDYLEKFVTPDISYFSYLRKYSELKIVEMFSKYKKYFPAFSSCNRNFKITKTANQRWCGACPKCAFTFSQLAAYLTKKEMIKIFGKNLFADAALWPLYQELLGLKDIKPFDCVGEPAEVKAAFFLAARRKEYKNDAIIKNFLKSPANQPKNQESLIKTALNSSPENNIPANFKKIIILGLGQEGRFALDYLKKKYAGLNLDITLADQKLPAGLKKTKYIKTVSGQNYLKNLENYDLIIKSPGISPHLPEIKSAIECGQELTSVTNMFFAANRGTIIGVTATKGKSTTASLIYEMLKAAGHPVHLVGNIGFNPLQYLEKDNGAGKIFVYELSSYQLELLRQSPSVAVFLNIFPDHLPYHRGLENYRQAKANIAEWQNATDYFIYNSSYKFINNLAKNSSAKKIDYSKTGGIKDNYFYYQGEKLFPAKNIKLLGAHNQSNILAAVAVAKIFGASTAAIKKAVTNFKGLEHRLEFAGIHKNIMFYDDAISTTPESTLAALEVFKNNLGTILLGGENRGYDFSALAEKLAAIKVKNIVLFPDSGAKIWQAIVKAYGRKKMALPNKIKTKSMAAAVKFAYEHTPAGSICLLSTASPSYSIFKNFIEKGNLFRQAIKKYGK